MSNYISKVKDSDMDFVIINFLPGLIKNHVKKSFDDCGYFMNCFSDFSKNEYERDIYSNISGIPYKELDPELQEILKTEFIKSK